MRWWQEGGGVAHGLMMGIIDGHYCPLSTVRSTRGSVLFHYRADVLLGLFDPLHLREVRYSCASTQRVLVFYLPNKQFGFHAEKVEEKVKSRSIRNNGRTDRDTAQHQKTQQTQNMELNTRFFFPEKWRSRVKLTPQGSLVLYLRGGFDVTSIRVSNI